MNSRVLGVVFGIFLGGYALANETTRTALLHERGEAAEIPRTPVSLTVSGGVSLGAYEAGYLYYTSRFFRENKSKFALKLVTGASAGAINSLLSVMSSCSSQQVATPSDSLFWQTWMPIGFRELLGTKARQKPSAAFTTEALERSAIGIEDEWMKGLDERCDVVFGVATTLLKPAQLRLTSGIQAEHQEEPFILRIQGRGHGKPPLITNYVDGSDKTPHALLYLPEDDHGRFLAFQNLLLASAAFPAAFPPVKLKLCRTGPGRPQATCDEKEATEEYFVDGGIFDNEPLRLAARIAARGLKQNGKYFDWNELPTLKNRFSPKELNFKSIDVDAKTYPSEPQLKEARIQSENEPIIPYFEKFFSRFITSARSQQLYSVLEENPNLENSIQSSKNNFPLASEPGLAFAGFFDRGFREIDFYLGMYDARKTVLSAKENQSTHVVYPEGIDADSVDWKIFACVKSTLDHSSDQDKLCGYPEISNTRKLLQLSFDRLYNNCSGLDPHSDLSAFPNKDCIKAANGEQPPQVGRDTNVEDWKRHPEEDEGLYSLRVLAQNHYHFEIIDDADASPREVLITFKTDVKNAFESLANRQPGEDRFLLNFAGEPAFNLISYSPPTREYHFLLGELVEAGGSLAITDWLRIHGAVTIRRPQDIFTTDHGDFALAPLAGIEIEPKGLSTALIQPRIGARAGFQFTPRDSWGSSPCDSGDNCSRLVVEPYLSATVYERLRLQLVEQILPASREQTVSFNSFIQLGLEFTP